MSPVYVVDVSEHDRDRRGAAVSWAQVAAAGLDAAMIARASYGDPEGFNPSTRYFAEAMRGAQAVSLQPRGGYHNLVRGDQASINRQVDLLRAQLDKYDVEFGMVDVEAYEELKDQSLTPRWSDCLRWNDRWHQVDDRVCTWYVARWYWRDYLGQADLTQLRGPLINASYAGGVGGAKQIYGAAGGDSHPGWEPYGGRTPDLLQYTSSASIPGVVKAGVTAAKAQGDVSAFRGSVEQLHALLLNQPVQEDNDVAINEQAFHDLIYTVLGLAQGDTDITIPQMAGGAPERTIANRLAQGMAGIGDQVTALSSRLDQLTSGGGGEAGTVDSLPLIAAVREESAKVIGAVGDLQAQGQRQAARLASAYGDEK